MENACPFCKSLDIVDFGEHYTFCKDCTAIYTYYMVQEINCEHITKDTVCAERSPWFKRIREAVPHIIETETSQACSVCGAEVVADGW